MAEIYPRAIARRHYQRRMADPDTSALTVSIDARRDLRAGIAEARASFIRLVSEMVRDVERVLYDELLAAAAA